MLYILSTYEKIFIWTVLRSQRLKLEKDISDGSSLITCTV